MPHEATFWHACKGRVACEINSGDELVATEMIFAGALSELAPEEAVALLSALVFQVSNPVFVTICSGWGLSLFRLFSSPPSSVVYELMGRAHASASSG